MAVVDATSGKTLANPAIGKGPDAARYDAKRKLAFSSNGEGTLTIIDAGKSSYPVLQNLTTQRGARTLTLDEVSGRIFLATASFGEPPPPTPTNQHPRPPVLPDSFTILVVASVVLSAINRRSTEAAFDERLGVYLKALVANVATSSEEPVQLIDPQFELARSGWYWQITRLDGEGGGG